MLTQAMINFFMFRMMGLRRYIRRIWSLIDFLILLISIYILAHIMGVLYFRSSDGIIDEDYELYRDQTITLRVMIMFGQILLMLKTQQFLTMVD